MNSLFSIDAEELDYFDEDDDYLTNISIVPNITAQNKTNRTLDSPKVVEQSKSKGKCKDTSEDASVLIQKMFDKLL